MKNSSNKYRHAPLILLLFPVISGFSFGRDITWQYIQTKISNSFPQVSHISTDSLKNILTKEKFFLIDVRDHKEFIISRIPGAIHIPTPEKVTYDKNSYIIVYCSVGYRSANFASKLQEAGFTRVYNLRGSIFE
ncbi:MAG: rhodanese-like domain-containing protein, partial [Bacteroidetes bacterium]|nr:rhodanese-like domain-containing protein [Bacteroidota bacterium]